MHVSIPSNSNYYGDINFLLHEARGALLREMPPCNGTLLSAGCSGLWYFEWIAERYKSFKKHIGIEFYSPKPDNLPANVQWISNTVGDMHGVKDTEVDLIFSGQNLEHLWPEDVIGFYLESWRVLKHNGYLVVDSPNREITQAHNWSHPEHIIEFTPDEACKLAALAGFDVTKIRGIWLCRQPDTGLIMPHSPSIPVAEWGVIERLLAAPHHPKDSFIWWLEARKSARKPDRKALTDEVNRIFALAWPERSTRFLSLVGHRVSRGQKQAIVVDEKTQGAMVYGPYMPLKAGKHTAEFQITITSSVGGDETPAVRCDIMGDKERIIAVREFSAKDMRDLGGIVRLDFTLPELEFGIQARCFALGNAAVECLLPVVFC